MTGHEDPTKKRSAGMAPSGDAHGTLVFLMGVKNLPAIVANLRREGKPADTPAAVIRWGTRASQRTVIGTLGTIAGKTAEARIEPPSIIVVGEVVRLREQLNWFETRPLFGKRVLVTRARVQAGELSGLLAEQGAEPVECPTIQIMPPDSWADLDAAIADLRRYQWLVFTA